MYVRTYVRVGVERGPGGVQVDGETQYVAGKTEEVNAPAQAPRGTFEVMAFGGEPLNP